MGSGIDASSGSKEAVVADVDGTDIENDGIEVHIDVIAHVNVAAIIVVDRRLNEAVRAAVGDHLFEECGTLLGTAARIEIVVLLD